MKMRTCKLYYGLNYLNKRCFSYLKSEKPEFGIIFDIDGVIARGRNVLPAAKAAFTQLTDEEKKLKMPVVFVTNAGNCLRRHKSDQLSTWLDLKIEEEKVIMSHSPLKLFKEFHKKHTLLSGQGPIETIAENLGFKNYTTIEELRHVFPLLDAVDIQRRNVKETTPQRKLQPIEAVLLLGEPVRWETSLQLIVDTLVTNGFIDTPPRQLYYPHLPVLACNMDLQWMSEASMPRFGHGTFLLCLEELYRKICGAPLKYTASVGKPSEITFHTAFCLLMEQAKTFNSYPKRIYTIGDNLFTDVYGAKLYDKFLKKKNHDMPSAAFLKYLIESDSSMRHFPDKCSAILVETGVYTHDDTLKGEMLNHHPRDFSPSADDLKPNLVFRDVQEAVTAILKIENYV